MPKNLPNPRLSVAQANAFLRGLATLAVIVIHVLANIPHIFRPVGMVWESAVVIDQFSRFAVPLFVMLSGYGFWQKYQHQEFHWGEFLWRQAWKLLPLYILASAVCYGIFLFIPSWRDPEIPQSFVAQLLLGKADYQLYFIPAIFQLYLLFPLLRAVVQKWPWVTLAVALVFQIWLYQLYSATEPSPFITKYLLTDQQQYIWFFSWIFYFVLGMHLPKILSWFKGWDGKVVLLGLLAAGALGATISRVHSQLIEWVDPIIVLRSTHIDMLVYATFMSLFLCVLAQVSVFQTKKWLTPILWIGTYSYPIYLFHAMVLRTFFAL